MGLAVYHSAGTWRVELHDAPEAQFILFLFCFDSRFPGGRLLAAPSSILKGRCNPPLYFYTGSETRRRRRRRRRTGTDIIQPLTVVRYNKKSRISTCALLQVYNSCCTLPLFFCFWSTWVHGSICGPIDANVGLDASLSSLVYFGPSVHTWADLGRSWVG